MFCVRVIQVHNHFRLIFWFLIYVIAYIKKDVVHWENIHYPNAEITAANSIDENIIVGIYNDHDGFISIPINNPIHIEYNLY